MIGCDELSNEIIIRDVVTEKDFEESLSTIRNSFITVVRYLNLTEENCPSNPAFIKPAQLTALRDKGLKLYGAYRQGVQVGFIAIEKAASELYYLEKLAVLPEFRHLGIGKQLLDFGFEYVRRMGGSKVSIAVINENIVLKNWYIHYGFREKELKVFPQLPFTVCFMEKDA